MTEQAFLNRGHFDFTLDPGSQDEGKERCIVAALKIWKLVEAYRKAFTLRRAQYGISYATYCAVLVVLQRAREDHDEYIECIQFFWLALLEYQSGSSHGLKTPLRLLRSLMRQVEKVTQQINVDGQNGTGWPNSSGM